jgi:hypothetical protein
MLVCFLGGETHPFTYFSGRLGPALAGESFIGVYFCFYLLLALHQCFKLIFIIMLHFPEGQMGEALNFQTSNIRPYIEEYRTERCFHTGFLTHG